MDSSNLHFDINHCLECGKELKGRLGKKYCDQACKSAYHNRHKSFGEETIRNLNRIMRHNRSILRTLCPEGKATIRKEVMDQMGYDYRYFSSVYHSPNATYYLVYDYGFAPIYEKGTEKALIIQKQDYMDQISFDIWRKG
jgi:hypothetical protein